MKASSLLSCSKSGCVLAAFLFLTLVGARADVVAGLKTDFKKDAFPPGWAYMWNGAGVLDNPASFVNLKVGQGPGPAWTAHGGPLPDLGEDGAGYLHVTQDASGTVTGHPGGADPKPKYVIFAYTISKAGSYKIVNSNLTSTSAGEGDDAQKYQDDGLDYAVYLNDKKIASGICKFNAPIQFDCDLGTVWAKDKIYVAVGPHKISAYDNFSIDFQIDMAR